MQGIGVLKQVITRARISREIYKIIGGNGHIKRMLDP
jgi:hypothetical protein